MPLPASQPVVTQLTIDASGASAGAAQYDAAMERAEAAANKLVAANDNLQKLFDQQSDTMKQVAAANDNVSRSWSGVIDGAESVGSHLENTTANILNTINHLKLLALAAYAMSPAFRGLVNAAIPTAVGMIGTAAAEAGKSIIAFFAPALSFFARMTVPIAILVAAWQALNAVIATGSNLLQKYSGRNLFSSDLSSNLAQLTKLQADTISADQVMYATELANRMDEADRKIDEFFRVSLDITDPALKLQNIWVVIKETIASVIGILGNIPTLMGQAANAIGNSSIWKYLNFGWNLPGKDAALSAGAPVDMSKALAAARGTLATAMGVANIGKDGAPIGGSFAARFSAAINDLANVDNSKKKAASDAYERAIQSTKDQIDLLKLEADGAGKTTQQYLEMKTAHELNLAAMKAGKPVTDDMRATWKALADQIADYTIKARAAAALQNEQFKGATMFMSPADQAAANVAHQIDPADWQSHMHDLASETARTNSIMGQLRDTSLNFLQSFNQDIMNGTVNMNTLANAVKGLGTKLLDIAENTAINALFSGGVGAGTGGTGGLLAGLGKLFGFQDGGSFVVPAGPGALALPGYANGADFVVRGSGAPDSKVAMFRVSPQERVTVTPPGKSSGGSATIINILPVAGTSFERQDNGDGTVTMVQKMIDRSIGSYDKGLPDRMAQINRDPRLRGR